MSNALYRLKQIEKIRRTISSGEYTKKRVNTIIEFIKNSPGDLGRYIQSFT